MRKLTLETTSADETRAIGAHLSRYARPGDLILLHGDLGAGKTTMVQGFLAALGAAEPVRSPTFILVSEYAAGSSPGQATAVRHLDLYRIEDPGELEALGFEELVGADDAVTLVEWPERAAGYLPEPYLLVEIAMAGNDRRWITLRAVPAGDRYLSLMESLGTALKRQYQSP
jgi:tRNA threonylcarbamoyladenosine biosynthesis protein TsaE